MTNVWFQKKQLLIIFIANVLSISSNKSIPDAGPSRLNFIDYKNCSYFLKNDDNNLTNSITN